MNRGDPVRLAATAASLAVGGKLLVDGVDAAVRPGTLVALVGPNGAGKTSLLRLLAGALRPTTGGVALDGRPVHAVAAAARARMIAYQPQGMSPVWAMRADAVVASARFAHGLRGAPARDDGHARAIADAMAATDTSQFADRAVTTLSGGELARVVLARTLATNASILLLDEPVAAMDLPHQEAAMAMLACRARDGAGVVATVHDLVLACRHAHRLWWMDGGRLVASTGPGAAEVGTMVAAIYGIDADAEDDGDGRMTRLTVASPRAMSRHPDRKL